MQRADHIGLPFLFSIYQYRRPKLMTRQQLIEIKIPAVSLNKALPIDRACGIAEGVDELAGQSVFQRRPPGQK